MLVAGGKSTTLKSIDIHRYSLTAQGFCLFALLVSFVLNRLYTYSKENWKRLEN